VGFLVTIESMTYLLSGNGEKLIKGFESLKLKPYKDVGGRWTIGWGHLLTGMELLNLNYWMQGITIQKAEQLFLADTAGAIQSVNRLVRVPITQNQFDALVSWTYNLGAGTLQKSSVLVYLNDKDYTMAGQKMKLYDKVFQDGKWVRVAGLIIRRRMEVNLFNKS
jgi:lysozyme